MCSHVAAILFKVETACRLGYNNPSCMSEQCVWNQALSVKVSDMLWAHMCLLNYLVPLVREALMAKVCVHHSYVCVCIHDIPRHS